MKIRTLPHIKHDTCQSSLLISNCNFRVTLFDFSFFFFLFFFISNLSLMGEKIAYTVLKTNQWINHFISQGSDMKVVFGVTCLSYTVTSIPLSLYIYQMAWSMTYQNIGPVHVVTRKPQRFCHEGQMFGHSRPRRQVIYYVI